MEIGGCMACIPLSWTLYFHLSPVFSSWGPLQFGVPFIKTGCMKVFAVQLGHRQWDVIHSFDLYL